MILQSQQPPPQRKPLTVGLFKKNQDNQLEDYEALNPNGVLIDIGDLGASGLVDMKLKQIQENPQQYFNFGFTYSDFKSYLLKLTYCRAIRKFVQRKRLQKIAQFQQNNTFTLDVEQQYEQMQ